MPTTPIMLLPYPAPADPADVPLDMQELAERIEAVRGVASGIASLGADGQVPLTELPDGVPNGIASLGPDGKVPTAQLPSGIWVPVSAVAQPNGVASLGADGKVPTAQLPAVDPWPSPPPATVHYGTALPGAPTDGMEAVLVDSVSAPTWEWRFRFNPANATGYQWEFVGGAEMLAQVAQRGGSTNSANSWADYSGTPGPSVTVPRSGVYRITWGLSNEGNPGGSITWHGLQIGGVNPPEVPDNQRFDVMQVSSGGMPGLSQVYETPAIGAGTTVRMILADERTDRRNPARNRWISVRPLRVA